jgi:hypothetical protein
MGIEARDFGKALRERVEKTATDVAKSEADRQITAFATGVREAALRLTGEEVRKAAADIKADLLVDSRMQDRTLVQVTEHLTEIDKKLAAVDLDAIRAVQAEITADMARLTKQRRQAAEELIAIGKAEGDLRRAAAALERQSEGMLHLATVIGKQIADLQQTTEDRARGAANLAVAALEGDLLKRLAEKSNSTDERLEGELSKLSDAVTASVVEATARIMEPVAKAVADLDATRETFESETAALHTDMVKAAERLLNPDAADAPLMPRDFRGPYVEKQTYQRGDLALFLGSTWIAKTKTSEKPAISTDPSAPWGLLAAGGFGGMVASGKPATPATARKTKRGGPP